MEKLRLIESILVLDRKYDVSSYFIAAMNLEAVKEAVVNLDKKQLTIVFPEGRSDVEEVKATAKEAGYSPA